MHRFKAFLSYPAQPLSASSIGWALRLTTKSFIERSDLRSKYRLRLWNLPRLALEQKQRDLQRHKQIIELQTQIGYEAARKRTLYLLEPYKLLADKAKTSRLYASLQQLRSEVLVLEGPWVRRVAGTCTNLSHKLKSFGWLDSASKFFVKYVNLYHESLQQMVEGHREVTHNHSTVLEAGKTVDEKLKAVRTKQFEAKLRSHLRSGKD
jgi:hypothetical protein